MSVRVETRTDASPARVWALYAQPRRWPEWAPHVRAARGLGEPEVRAGASGTVRLAGILPVPARITAVDAGSAWTWEVGPITLHHLVEPTLEGGSLIALELEAPAGLELALRIGYAPLTALLLRNLARVAEQDRLAG